MGKVSAAIIGAVVGGSAAAIALVLMFGWGRIGAGQPAHIDPTRGDYIDLLLVIATIFLGAVGLTVTVGALVVGLVAFKTLREIKDEAASKAKEAAAKKITETMASELEPRVADEVKDVLPSALQTELLDNGICHKILSEMAQKGELDEVLERVAMRMQAGGPEPNPDIEDGYRED